MLLDMKKVEWKLRQWGYIVIVLQLFLVTQCEMRRQKISNNNDQDYISSPPVQLRTLNKNAVVVDNGLVNITFTIPGGMVIGIEYNGIDNLLETENKLNNRGYWDVVWSKADQHGDIFDKLGGTSFKVVMQNEDQIELSFLKTWDPSTSDENELPLNIDKRYIILRGSIGFYSYAIFERLEGWPAINAYQGRIVFKLRQNLFKFMAVSDEKQRIMPTAEDRVTGKVLDYPEAVLLTDPSNSFLKGEVDDKYQYSSDNKDNVIHGWISPDPPTGFWMITPSNEFKTAGPVKQDLTSHTGPTTLSMFFSTHYAGESLGIKFEDGEAWKKVFGPVFIYLNSNSPIDDPLSLWVDAKQKMIVETESWPYDFPLSEDYHCADERGMVSGRLLVRDSFISERLITANSAYVGLAPPGEAGSWQKENKGYQFWTQTDHEGYFLIKNVRSENYSLYAWVPGFIGDYKYNAYLDIKPGSKIRLGTLIYEAPRNGPTLWEIGIPDRTAAEFFIPPPNPTLMNKLYVDNPERFRQYGLWERYTELYPVDDLVYTVGVDNYQTDWFYAHVNRDTGNRTYGPTTWQIVFDLESVYETGNYTLQLALASSNEAELQIRINDPDAETPHFTTDLIGKDNAIARHGIHGLYWLFSVNISCSQLVQGRNTIFLRQARGLSPWKGIMYDYIRLESPPENT